MIRTVLSANPTAMEKKNMINLQQFANKLIVILRQKRKIELQYVWSDCSVIYERNSQVLNRQCLCHHLIVCINGITINMSYVFEHKNKKH